MLRKPTSVGPPGIAQHDVARVLPVTHASGRRRLSAELGHWACVISTASSRGMRTSVIHDASPRFSAIVNAPNRSNRSVPDPGALGGRSEEGPNLLAHIIAVLRRNGMTLHDWRVNAASLQTTASRHFGRLVLARRWGKRSPRNTRLRSDNCLSFGFGLVVDSAEPKAAEVRLVAYAANARSRCACHADGRAVRRQFVASCLL